jgi:hypothetical protein
VLITLPAVITLVGLVCWVFQQGSAICDEARCSTTSLMGINSKQDALLYHESSVPFLQGTVKQNSIRAKLKQESFNQLGTFLLFGVTTMISFSQLEVST